MNDKRLPTERLTVVSYVIVGVISLLLFGFWKLQIIDSDRYAQMAERNRVRSIPIIAPRGSMLDREGRVLVDNYPSFSVLLLRDSPEQVEKLLPQIADGLGMTLDDVKQQIESSRAMPKFQPIVIKPEASPSDIAFIESHRVDIPVIEMLMVHRRRYPHGDMLANAVGYVGEVSAEQVEASDSSLNLRRVIVNSIGKEVGRLEQKDAIPSKPIQLTIDYDLQNIADTYMADKEGAVVAMDARTGEILAMVSRPTFDPNDFAIRIPTAEWQSLNTDPRTPLLNRAIQGQLAPGSVFKIVMSAAMLESKGVPENFTVVCRCSNPRACRRISPWFAPDTLISTDESFTAGGRRDTVSLISTRPSCNPVTFSSIRLASGWESKRSMNTALDWAWAAVPESTCRVRNPV